MNREEMQTELDALKSRINEIEFQLESQPSKPKWVPFPGELIEVRNPGGPDPEWKLRRFVSKQDSIARYRCADSGGIQFGWISARPLSDPNVIQLRPHTPGDPMPCDGDCEVIVKRRNGRREAYVAKSLDWGTWDADNQYQIHAWAPLQ